MSRKKTTEEFITSAIAKHGSTYGYEKVDYKGAKIKVLITCPEHKEWLALPNDHLNGSGCPRCAHAKNADSKRKSEAAARKQIFEIHGSRYQYKENLGYTSKNSKIDIFCTDHGWFSQTFHNHAYLGSDCPSCALKEQGDRCRKSLDNFVKDAREVHGSRYSYEKVEYVNSETKVEIICKEHDSFWQAPGSHLSGRGCPYCAVSGFKGDEPGVLYVLTDGEITKVGITNNAPELRCKAVARDSCKDLRVLKSYHFEQGWKARKIEFAVLQELKSQYSQPLSSFDGWKECFYYVNLAPLLNRIEELISQQIKEQNSSNNQAAKAA